MLFLVAKIVVSGYYRLQSGFVKILSMKSGFVKILSMKSGFVIIASILVDIILSISLKFIKRTCRNPQIVGIA